MNVWLKKKIYAGCMLSDTYKILVHIHMFPYRTQFVFLLVRGEYGGGRDPNEDVWSRLIMPSMYLYFQLCRKMKPF